MSSPADTHSSGAISKELFRQLAYNEKMAELGRISAGIVHELNAPLSLITSAAQMILREEEIPDFVREMVGRIGSEAQRLAQLTRGLLSFGSHDESAGESDVNLTADFVLDFIRFEAAQRGVILSRQLDYRLPLVKISDNVLKQVLLNIIMNALQAMEGTGGTLLLESSQSSSEKIQVTVTDTGPGIPEAARSKIFDAYFTTKKAGTGTGLGLFVTKALIEQNDGTIEISDNPDGGTIFTITLNAGA